MRGTVSLCWIQLAVICFALRVSAAIRLLSVEIPSVAAAGESVTLSCEVDLEDGDLYAVKWYKDGEEFYRFAPRRTPSVQTYHIEGVHVDKEKSRGAKVILRSLSLSSSGFFRCEISAEAPSFSSVQGGGGMVVIIPPKKLPEIFGGIITNGTDEYLDLNCGTDASRPTAVVRWYINGIEVDPDLPRVSHTRRIVTGLETTTSSLQIPLNDRKYFWKSGATSIVCEAAISVPWLAGRLESSRSAWRSDSGASKKLQKQQHMDGRTSASSATNSIQGDRFMRTKPSENLKNLVTRSDILVFVSSGSSSITAAALVVICSVFIRLLTLDIV